MELSEEKLKFQEKQKVKESIIVDTKNKKSVISRDIYGHFSEHLGRCIYGGFWVGKDSPIPNIHGYNKAVVEAFKELDIPNLRWPIKRK